MRLLTRFLFLFACVGALAGCAKKRDPLTSAQIFLQQVAANQTDAAYQSAAFGFQAQHNAAGFAKAAQEMGLVGSAKAEWEQPEQDGRNATVKVNVTTRTGQTVPLIISLLDESSAWRVFSLRTPPSAQTGLVDNRFSLVGKIPSLTEGVARSVPPEDEIRALVRDHLLLFNEAIEQKSFDVFYDSVSRKWQGQLTKGQLQRAFQPFIDKNVNIALVADSVAVLEPEPRVNSEGLLLVSGYYPTQPFRVHFLLKFYYELPSWKLFGMDVNLVRPKK
jgi:hypothetical protein